MRLFALSINGCFRKRNMSRSVITIRLQLAFSVVSFLMLRCGLVVLSLKPVKALKPLGLFLLKLTPISNQNQNKNSRVEPKKRFVSLSDELLIVLLPSFCRGLWFWKPGAILKSIKETRNRSRRSLGKCLEGLRKSGFSKQKMG